MKSESHSVVSNSLQTHRLHSPWNSPGQSMGVGSLSLLQGIFPTQGSNPGLPHCRRILYQLIHKGSPLKTWVISKNISQTFSSSLSQCHRSEETPSLHPVPLESIHIEKSALGRQEMSHTPSESFCQEASLPLLGHRIYWGVKREGREISCWDSLVLLHLSSHQLSSLSEEF